MTRGQRIAYAIEQSGNTPASMARMIGCTSAAIYQCVKGETKDVRNDLLFALADATGFEARWIATGQGAQKNEKKRDIEQLKTLYENLDERGKAEVLRVAEAVAVYAHGLPHKRE